MLANLYLLVSKNLTGTGIVGIVFAGFLAILLIWDASQNGQRLDQRNKWK